MSRLTQALPWHGSIGQRQAYGAWILWQTASCARSVLTTQRCYAPHLQCDVTGIAVAVCRHQQPLTGTDMYVGERYAFATLLLVHIIAIWSVAVLYVWYDINCRYKLHWDLWLAAAGNQYAAAIANVITTPIQWPLPQFHRFMHR